MDVIYDDQNDIGSLLVKHLATIIRKADNHARQLVRRLNLSYAEREDIRQDLLVDFLCRSERFDPRRGHILKFAEVLMANESRAWARRWFRQRGLFLAAPISPNEEYVQADGALAVLPEQQTVIDVQMHLADAFAILNPSDRALVQDLINDPALDHRLSGLTRPTFYRRKKEIQRRLRMMGVAA